MGVETVARRKIGVVRALWRYPVKSMRGAPNADTFVGDAWLGGRIEIGEGVRVIGMRPALRCAITTHPQDELPHDAAILRTACQFHRAYAGLFAALEAE